MLPVQLDSVEGQANPPRDIDARARASSLSFPPRNRSITRTFAPGNLPASALEPPCLTGTCVVVSTWLLNADEERAEEIRTGTQIEGHGTLTPPDL